MNKIIHGDCIKEMKKLPENSVDAIITDPPYDLVSINKRFGKKGSAPAQFGKDGSFNRLSKGFMGKQWDGTGIAFGTAIWTQALRVLKPGGYLLSFGSTRTYHRMVCAIEDSGFEIRDTISWIYGSGFPKSLDIGKAIDKMEGNEREKIGERPIGFDDSVVYGTGKEIIDITKGSTEWEGWGTALKPSQELIVVARKPLSERTVALNVLKWGTGGINIDACRIGFEDTPNPATNPLYREQNDYKKARDSGQKTGEIIKFTNSLNPPNMQGRFPANTIFECTCDKLGEGIAKGSNSSFKAKDYIEKETSTPFVRGDFKGRGEEKTNIHTDPNCPCRMLDEQSGVLKSGGGFTQRKDKDALFNFGVGYSKNEVRDKGGASRFFYCPKASKKERNEGCEKIEIKDNLQGLDTRGRVLVREDGTKTLVERWGKTSTKNNHPTVKPIKLMEYLIKLVSKEGATILDPFGGSGTTMVACLKLNRKCILIEKEPEYIKIINARVKPYLK